MNYDLPGFIKLGENIVAYQCERAHTHTRTVHTIAQPCSGFRDAVSFHTEKPKYFLFLFFFSSIVRYYLSRHFFTPLLLDASSTLNKLNFPVETDSGGGANAHNERTRSRKTKRHKWRKSVASDDAKGDGKIFFLEPWMGRGRSEEIPIPPFLSPPPHRGKISRKCQQQIDLVQNRIILSETSIYLCAHDVHASKKIVRDDLEYIKYIYIYSIWTRRQPWKAITTSSLSLSRSSFVTYTEEEARDAHRWSNYYRSRW